MKRYYLNDHNEPIGIEETGMGALDVAKFKESGMVYP